MKKIAYAIDLLSMLRKQKQPPLTRYTIVLAVAQTGRKGATAEDVRTITHDETISSQLDNLVEGPTPPLRRVADNVPGKRNRWRYFLTAAGQKMAASVLNPTPETATRA